MHTLVQTPPPPYYAVIFSVERTEGDRGYGKMAEKMVELATQQAGFLGIESFGDEQTGLTVSYWETPEAIEKWKAHTTHRVAQAKGKEEWYQQLALRVCRVERDHFFSKVEQEE